MMGKIDYKQFDSTVLTMGIDPETTKAVEKDSIELSPSFLAYYTGKAMLSSMHKFSRKTVGFARSYYQLIPFLLSEKDGYWAFDYECKKLLRDFSLSARVGELAQGINYYFCIKVLRAYSVWDFKTFVKCNSTGKVDLKGRLPDYVIRYKDGSISVLESKGICVKNPTKSLLGARGQYENGKNILASMHCSVKNAYGSSVSFATNSPRMSRNTCIYLVDPSEKANADVKMNYRAEIFRECAKHLCIAGQVDLANKFLVKSQNLYKNSQEVSNITFDDLKETGTFSIISESGEVKTCKMGFTDTLIAYLRDNRSDAVVFEEHAENSKDYYSDGTYVEIINE